MGGSGGRRRSSQSGAAARLESPSMFARALIVVLIALNLGVAAWWWSRPVPPPPPVPSSDKGGRDLQLLAVQATTSESLAIATADDATSGVAAQDQASVAAVASQACLRVGPFADLAAAEAARTGLGAAMANAQTREEPGRASRYRVLLPAAGDRAQAQAVADRIAAAGFDDFFILSQGEEANRIALGAYSSSDTAERRATALRVAGFPAEVHAQGATGASRWWLQGASGDPAAVRSAFPATQELDCAALPGTALR